MTSDSNHSLFIFAGELSGDMYGARLLKALKKKMNTSIITGVAGPEMRAQGVQTILKTEDFGVMGFVDVLMSLPKLWRQFNLIRDYILSTSPKAAIFIDSGALSIRMARALRKRGYKGKIVQYICPGVWAWGKGRIPQMAKYFDLLLTIFPFEPAYFAQTSLPVQFVGHPLLEIIRTHRYDPHWHKLFGIRHPDQLVALFPGSRTAEIKRNLPKQIEAVKLLQRQNMNVSVAISCAHEHNMELVQKILKESNLHQNREVFLIPKAYSYDLMRACRSAIAKSGTVTLELALLNCPTVVVYELSCLDRFIAKQILRVNLPSYCIVNILGEKRIFPELIERKFSPETLYEYLKSIHEDGKLRKRCLDECKEIKALLTNEEASERAALAIEELVQ
jgi:lipid-A-disaccharide synthase